MTSASLLSMDAASAFVRAMPGFTALIGADGGVRAVSPPWAARFGEQVPLRPAEGTLAELLGSGQRAGTAAAHDAGGVSEGWRWSAQPLEVADGRGWLVVLEAPQKRARADRYGDPMRQLYRISTTSYASLDDLLRDVLAIGCKVLEMPIGAVNMLRGETCRYRAVMPADALIRVGEERPIHESLCGFVQQHGRTVVYPDLGQVPGGPAHFAYREQGARAYVGVPLRNGKELYGSLFFADFAPHAAVDDRAVEFAELMARHVESAIEREHAEREIQEARQLLLNAQRIAHVGSWQWQSQTGRIIWSDELYRIFDLPIGSDVSFETYMSRIHPDDRDELKGLIEQGVAQCKGYTTQHRVVWPSGAVRYVHSVAEARVDEEDGLVLTGTAQDVTERMVTQQAMRENEERFRLLAENASDMICLHAPDGTYRYVSPSVKRTAGFDPEELVGTSAYDLIHPDDLARIRTEDHEAVLRGESTMTLLRTRRKDGQYIWVETFLRPILDDGRVVHLQSSSRDVTERVLAEQALARTNQVLEQRNRELQDFAYVASHDLQEPLRKIRAFTDLLEQDNADQLDEQGRHYLGRIDDAAGRMSRLISDLLTFSRVTTRGKPFEQVNLARIVSEVLEDLEIALQESGGEVACETLPEIEADPVQMRQLFQNLIGNALKFREPGRPPRVQVRARMNQADEGEAVVVEVADNGIGFDEKYLDRIFTPFQRLHNRQQYAGTGMGLAICRRIVERHHGQITAISSPGTGTTFVVTLPCSQPAPTELSTPT